MFRVSFDEVGKQLASVLRSLGFSEERARLSARLFAETTCDGVYSHGVNRFPRFVAMVRNGSVDPDAEPRIVARFGAMERCDGRRGPGNLNAHAAMARAVELSGEHGIGCVALANTNHWMRGGTYGWQAADSGVIGICWTNTMPNVPPWGGLDAAIGNNPVVLAVPRANGHVVLDMAMSQFSYGALESYRRRGEMLPVEGGFDAEGKVTRDPAAIEASQRLLPIGFWKGSGLAVMLDLIASMTSMGNATHQIANDPLRETGLSQMFVAIDPRTLGDADKLELIADEVVASLHRSRPAEDSKGVRYPGENTLRLREENRRLGLAIDEVIWAEIGEMTK
ncbi:3-dehydro-L-gulonate 2-dehydrogenase [Occallatibacter savannae]|uniref:3-dehydro-L-gulonate 2-dehydrogenase n=1 Tax=Occallatibacter savannae TaxID=1002691 RepID=UPI000D6927DC|nr:3-dehydro-L-gulonate 2-dehydrogenase [Occallatibacter savannae]